ncbi:hypothetical protein NAEGRDRAFT_72102 [Naegleria gruberi]|uniref:Uncharacterized protein n=1 Tax=Naegleria gruberi TaxID=5762 RepID=D2VSY2_NAEGR|nr:uncharacterized protein NAEGRDRAFT_72102 [Naegleria gruberi]EFC40058.1 hypothetical protein NAEGRDRAFT_72102 [Naegleria gruberi]|eukprot:XP_002672802.1 hypothetical protein NAEGRDRAFT_72102 [Naegleria gruberi strain NEG-M]
MVSPNLDDLPCEILQNIFYLQCDPYQLFRQILTFRHINKTFRVISEDREGFWQPFLSQFRNKEYFDIVGMYFPTHAFIDKLLFRTQRNKFKDFTKHDDQLVVYYKGNDELICYESDDDEQGNLFEKFAEWLDAYSSTEENILMLKALIQVCIGREMLAHLGSNQVNVMIEMFFEKLLEPAVKLVNSWEEKPNEIEWNDQIVFNTNLLNVIETPSLFDDITTCWNELDGISSCIPRKYLLYIVEKFNGINTLIDGSSTCMVTQIMKRLRDCGIKVERMRFCDVGIKMNFKRTESLEFLIPPMSKSFYLQHLAVWISSSTLLEWCLNVGTKFHSNLANISNNPSLNVPLEAHVKTYIHDAAGLTALHYSIQRGNVEISDLLINKYFANPFVQSRIIYNGKRLTPCILSQIDESSEKEKIYRLLQEKYGDIKVAIKINEKIKEVDRLNDIHKLSLEKMDADVWFDGGDEYSTSVQWREKEEHEPLKEFVTVETWLERSYEYDDYISDESESEYGLSYEWLESQVKNQTSLKRKRNPYTDYIYNENLRKIRKPLEELELVRWNPYQGEYLEETNSFSELPYDEDNWPLIKILKRRPNSKPPAEEDEIQDENETIDDEKEDSISQGLGPEFITRKDLILPKARINLLIEEVLMDYKNDTNVLPNGKMLIQQASEQFLANNFKLAQDIAEFSGRDYVIASDITLAHILVASKTELIQEYFSFMNSRKTYNLQRFRDEFVENLNLQPEQVHEQLRNFIQDDTILKTLVDVIEDQFESVYLDDETEEEMDPDYDGESIHSSDSTYYSDDSMISNVCQQESFYGCDTYCKDLCYSVNTANTFQKQKSEAILRDRGSGYLTVHEKEGEAITRVVFTEDRRTAIQWIEDGLF